MRPEDDFRVGVVEGVAEQRPHGRPHRPQVGGGLLAHVEIVVAALADQVQGAEVVGVGQRPLAEEVQQPRPVGRQVGGAQGLFVLRGGVGVGGRGAD